MSTRSFVKYQAAGNDFILLDDRTQTFDSTQVKALCHRRFGIGADGVILLQCDPVADFRMRIFNKDGSEAESCGNGLRCLMKFLLHLGLPNRSYRIATANHLVEAHFDGEKIHIQPGDIPNGKQLYICGYEGHSLDTGVPHLVVFVPDVQEVDILKEGPILRHHVLFQPRGTNVNFATLQSDGSIRVRTFERGLEGESLACGTGAAAVGVVASQVYRLPSPMRLCFPGGEIGISLNGAQVQLIGEAHAVFQGTI